MVCFVVLKEIERAEQKTKELKHCRINLLILILIPKLISKGSNIHAHTTVKGIALVIL